MRTFLIIVIFILIAVIVFGVTFWINTNNTPIDADNQSDNITDTDNTSNQDNTSSQNNNTADNQNVAIAAKFSINDISDEIAKEITGLSWKPDAPVALNDLRYLQITYWGFDDKEHTGELIVNKKVADEVIDIFKELLDAKFPIAKMRLVDNYGANDDESMADNNASSFNYRPIAGMSKLSYHSYGLAIDINPVQNPYILNGVPNPEESKEYLDRTDVRKGMIVEGDVCYNAFISKGWIWGGSWKNGKDYQHFEKRIK